MGYMIFLMANLSLDTIRQRQSESFASAAEILTALSSPVRLRLVHLLSQGPQTVEILSKKLGASVANTSMHLRKLALLGLVKAEVEAQHRRYLLHPAMFDFWEQTQDFLQHFDPQLFELTPTPDGARWELSARETRSLLDSGKAILLDVRPADERAHWDLPARWRVVAIAGHELRPRLAELPRTKKILVACRGRLCALGTFSVTQLRAAGLEAYRLPYSFHQLIPTAGGSEW